MSEAPTGIAGEYLGNVPPNGPDIVGYPASVPSYAPQSSNGAGETADVVPTRRVTRQMAKEMKRLAAEGVPMWMDRTGLEATVRALSFADKTMLGGIEPRIQAEITAGFNARGITARGGTGGGITFGDMLRGVSNEERLANAVCVAGFIYPRLTLTEQEADLANNEDVWWVQDLNIEDRRKYCNFVLGQDDAEAKRIANFLGDRVSNTGVG